MPANRRGVSLKQLRGMQQRFQNTFGTSIEREVLLEGVSSPPKLPPFPWAVVGINIIIDVLSILASLSVFLGITVVIPWWLAAMTWIINTVWFLNKSDGVVSRRIQKYVLRRATWFIIFFFVTDLVPFNNLITANTLLVLSIHYRETKAVRAFWLIIEEFYRMAPNQIARAVQDADAHVIRQARNRQQSSTN